MLGAIHDTPLYRALDERLHEIAPCTVDEVCRVFGAERRAVLDCLLTNDFWVIEHEQGRHSTGRATIVDYADVGPQWCRAALSRGRKYKPYFLQFALTPDQEAA